jgi:hypothetical protein
VSPAPPIHALRNAGYVACLVGTLAMIAGRFMAGAPAWLIYAGISGIIFGWGLFGYAAFQRFALARAANSAAKR